MNTFKNAYINIIFGFQKQNYRQQWPYCDCVHFKKKYQNTFIYSLLLQYVALNSPQREQDYGNG